VNRFFTGQRRPSPDAAKRVNLGIAELVGHPPVEDYLNFVAASCGLLQDVRFGDDALDAAAAWCIRWYGRFLNRERLHDFMSPLGKGDRRKLVMRLNRALRRIVVEVLLPPTRPVGFVAVLDALEKSGIPIKEIVSDQHAEARAWEHFEWVVRYGLAAVAGPRVPARKCLAQARRIFEAVTLPVLASVTVSLDGVSADGLREVKTPEFGKQVSRFYGDPRAAWIPFVPPTITKIEFSRNSGRQKQKRKRVDS
jgi:hypothetical protein